MPAPFSGSNFTNLQSIINANQNNQLGNTIQGGVQKGLSGLTSGLNQSQQQFQTDVNNANNQQQNQTGNNVVGQTISGIQNAPQVSQAQTPAPQVTDSSNAPPAQPPPQQSSSPAPSPTQPAQPSTTSQAASSNAPAAQSAAASQASQTANSAPGSFGAYQTPTISVPAGQAAQVGQWAQGSYTGPTQLNNYAGLQAQAQNLQQQGQQVNTPGGLQALLQQYVGGPQYNQGEQKLDTLLLGQTGRPQLQNVLNSTQNLTNLPQSAEAQAAATAAGTAAANQQFAQDIQGQITAAENPITQAIQQQINQGQTTSQNNLNLAQQIYAALTASAPNTPYVTPGTAGLTTASYPVNQYGVPYTKTATGYADQYGNELTKTATGWADQYGNPATMMNTASGGIATGYTNVTPSVIGQVGNGPALGNITAPSGSSLSQADQALKDAVQGGLINQQTATNLAGYLASQKLQNGNTPQSALLGALSGYTPGMTLSSVYNPSQQQAATAQQAAQMNALQQLAGQTPTYGTYGGANPYAPSFDLTKLAGYDPTATYNAPTPQAIIPQPSSSGGGIFGAQIPSIGQALTPGAGIIPGYIPGAPSATSSYLPSTTSLTQGDQTAVGLQKAYKDYA